MDLYGAYAPFYDLDFGGSEDDVLMIEQFAARCDSPILELGCGTGRLLVPLARKGYDVTGVDVSEAMLGRAQRKVAAEGTCGKRRSTCWKRPCRVVARWSGKWKSVSSPVCASKPPSGLVRLSPTRRCASWCAS